MKQKFIYFIGLLLIATTALANPAADKRNAATITGHVLDYALREHLPYVTISLKGTTVGVTTDESGHYQLRDLPLGKQILVASYMGYETQEIPVTVEAHSTLRMDFELREQKLQIDEVVVSATRNETNKLTSPTIVNVASMKLFETTSSNNLAESMTFQPGLRIENNCGNCGTTQLRINGLEGQYSQILLDSRPIFSSLSGVYGLEQLPVSMIERVEVVRGGGSALFGSSAIGGVVNIITKEPLRNTMTLSNNTNVLKGGSTDISTSLNGSFVSSDFKTGVYLFGMVKNREAYERNGDGFSELPEIDSETLGFRAYHKTSHYSKLTAEYHHIHEYRRGGDSLQNAPHNSYIAEMTEHQIDGGGLNFDYFSPNYKHKLGLYTSAQQVLRKSYYGAGKDPNGYGNTTDHTFVAGAQYSYMFDNCLFLPATLTAGTEYTYNNLHDIMVGYNRDMKQTTNIYGAFLQNEWQSEKLNFLVGGRLDKHNLMNKAVFSPRANIRYSPIKPVGLRASYSSGYRAPQAFDEDLHIEAVGGTVSLIELDPNLRPEYSHSFSTSADLYHSFGAVQANLLVEGFYTALDDVFTLEKIGESAAGQTILQRRNAEGATVKGVTAELKVGIPDRFEVQLGYTFQHSRYNEPEAWSDDVEAQTRMFRSPDHYGYMTANYNITKRFKASLFGNYTGSMLVQRSGVDGDSERITPDFWDMGARLSYDFTLSDNLNLELNGGVKNLFDAYQSDLEVGADKDAGYVYGPSMPRTVFVGVKLTL